MREEDPLREDSNEVQALPCGRSSRVQTGCHDQLLNRKFFSAGMSGEKEERTLTLPSLPSDGRSI